MRRVLTFHVVLCNIIVDQVDQRSTALLSSAAATYAVDLHTAAAVHPEM